MRCVGSTSMNAKSSRSHAIFILNVLNKQTEIRSTLYLVDLAGSERIKKSNVSGERIDEAIAINSSLTTLGKCIIALGEKKVGHVPFRESKLTKILQDALGGRCKTALILTLSPELEDLEETVSSLLFGQRAKKVQMKPIQMEASTPKSLADEYKKQLEIKTQLLQEVSTENKRLQMEIKTLLAGQLPKKDESYHKLELKLKVIKKEHQTRLEDMDALMLKQEKEITRLREKLSNAGINAYASKDNQYMSSGPEEVSKRLKFSETNLLQEASKNKENLRSINKSGRKDGFVGVLRAGSTSPLPSAQASKPLRVCLEEFLAEETPEDPKALLFAAKGTKTIDASASFIHLKDQDKSEDLHSKYAEAVSKLEEMQKRVKELESELQGHKVEQEKIVKANKLLVEENDQLISEHRRGTHTANEQPARPDLVQEMHNQLNKHRIRVEELEEETAMLKEEVNYLKEINQSLESENQTLEEELVLAKDTETEDLKSELEEARLKASSLKEELEKAKIKSGQMAAENYSMADENIKMAKTIAELKEKEARMVKEIASLEENLARLSTIQPKDETTLNLGGLTSSKIREEISELARLKTLEAEADKWRRRDEEKEYKIVSLQNDLAAAETQVRIGQIRSEEMIQNNLRLEERVKVLESEQRERSNHREEELDKLKRVFSDSLKDKHKLSESVSQYEGEVRRLKELVSGAEGEKRDLEAILAQYRHQEQNALTSDQELERFKGILLESDNWNSVRSETPVAKGTGVQPASLEIILKEARSKIHEFVSGLLPAGGESKHIPSKAVLKANMETQLQVPRQNTRKILTAYFTQVYFYDFEKSILSVSSGKQLQQTLVREYAKARKCLRELATSFEGVLLSLMEHEYLARVEAMRYAAVEQKLDKFRMALRDPEFQLIRLQFLQICTAPIRLKYAALKIQAFFKRIRQQKRMSRLQKRHKSQYERFQAGSGKNMLQMLMKTAEGAMCELYEKLGPIEEDLKVLQKRKTKGAN